MKNKSMTATTAAMRFCLLLAKHGLSDDDVRKLLNVGRHTYDAILEGELPVPLPMVVPFRQLHGNEPGFLFQFWMRDYNPELEKVMLTLFGDIFTDADRGDLKRIDMLLKDAEEEIPAEVSGLIEGMFERRKNRRI